MNDIITLSFNAAESCGLATALLSVGAIVWLRVKEYNTDSKTKLLAKVNDDLERLHNNTNASKGFSISAKDAKGFVEACATGEEIDKILVPVFDKVYEASIKGDSEVYIYMVGNGITEIILNTKKQQRGWKDLGIVFGEEVRL